MFKKIYEHEYLREISFPLGGIGSGCIGIAGNGALVDFEIFGKPNKRSRNGFSHFAIKAENNNEIVDARILNGDLLGSYMGNYIRGGQLHSGYGFGPSGTTLAGLPHFEKCQFSGEFPIAEIDFNDSHFPGTVKLMAFNPFIPHNDRDSSIPAAFFEICITNTSNKELNYTVALSMQNPIKADCDVNLLEQEEGFCGINLSHAENKELTKREQGAICISTDAKDHSFQQYWYRGGWCDHIEMFWNDFTTYGKFKNREYEIAEKGQLRKDTATIAAHAVIPAGETKTLRFVIGWYFPFMSNDWDPECDSEGNPSFRYWKHYYASLFSNAVDVAKYSIANFSKLYNETLLFHDALYSSSLPEKVLEAVGANLSVLKSPVCYRLEKGEFYAFEGALENEGSCEGSCTHVWNYSYALPFLFPTLERSMRDLEYEYCMGDTGDLSFRITLPLGRQRKDFRPCVDGQFGSIIKCYRDWKISGNDFWIKEKWLSLKKALEFAWSDENKDQWDPDKAGLITGRQHHTLDMELFGANSWLTGFYLTALKAASEIADYLNDIEAKNKYTNIFIKGRRKLNEELFNGSYYIQKLSLNNKDIIDHFHAEDYWNSEKNEIKYQISNGCCIDQTLAQWHSNLCGLGDIFDKEKTKTALQSLYNNNFKNMRDVVNTWRLFSLQDESGLLICTWPNDDKPAIPLTYASETMTGFEYAAACNMIQNGLLDEGISIVNAVRDRYDGKKRNPWNEIECGSNYARSMASYSLLIAFSGFQFDMSKKMIGFNPPQLYCSDEELRFFWSVGTAFGIAVFKSSCVEIKVLSGCLELKKLELPFIKGCISVSLGNENITTNIENGSINLLVNIKSTDVLKVSYIWNVLNH